MTVEILQLVRGDALYDEVIGAARRDRQLLHRMFRDAESRLDEDDMLAGTWSKSWWVAVDQVAGRRKAMAWCAAVLEWRDGAPFARCCNHYDVPEYRWARAYPLVVRERHKAISGLPGECWLFPEAIAPLVELGWRPAGEQEGVDWGWSEPDREAGVGSHLWRRMVYRPPGRQG